MSNVHIVYDSYDGQSEKIAHAMADVVRCLGHHATEENVEVMHGHIITSLCDAIIIGGPIHAGTHSKALREFVETNLAQLQMIPSAFFSVSLSAAGGESQRDDAQRCLETFLEQTQFKPLSTATLAGAVQYRKYGFFKRFLLQRIVGMAGGETDTSKNYEYTNWNEVSQFVERFLALAGIAAFSDESIS